MPMDNSFAKDARPELVAKTVAQSGYAIVRDAIDLETVTAVKTDLAPHLDYAHKGHEEFFGKLTKRFGALLAKSTAVQSLLLHPTVLAVADHALLPYCVRYHVHYTGVMHLEPTETKQILHRDMNIYPIANPSPPFTVATMWAISDFTRQNGGTRLVPGSHLWSNDRVPEPHEIVATEMTPGSVLIYTGNVIHGGGANRSDHPRTGVALHYSLGWLRQEENQYLAVPQELARELPEQIQELMGYALGSPNLGFVDHIEPKDYLHGVRNQAKSNLGPPVLHKRVDKLERLYISHTKKGNPRYYDIDTE